MNYLKKEDVSNNTVLVLAIIVVLVVASSLWIILNKLSTVDVKEPQQKVVTITKIIEQAPPEGGVVGLTILPQPKEGE